MSPQQFDPSYGATAPENYERFFVPAIGRPLAEDLIRTAHLRTGERVLDVGCGTGVVARLAAAAVGPGARVAGLDVNPGMLAVARSAAPNGSDIEWREAKAEQIPYADDSFDVVLCQMSLQFMEDRARALEEMRRVLAPDGRLVLNVPGPAAPLFETMAIAMGRHIAPPATGFVRAVFSLHDTDELETLLRGAGFHDVRVRADRRTLRLPGPRDFLWQYVGSTPLSAMVREADDGKRAALESDVVTGWQKHVDGDGMSLEQRVVTGIATR
jgi:ubiquinone/menaquinone biosynthesis C-methylase UbiE